MRFLSILSSTPASIAALPIALSLALPWTVPANAQDCKTDPQTFSFLPQPAETLHAGTDEEVARVYAMLADNLSDLGTYPRTTLFLTRNFQTLTLRYCEGSECTQEDLSTALRTCARGGTSTGSTCYPLAAVYEGELYCLLAPADADPSAPYAPFEE